ncbi:hypothetical protein QC762_0062650 [Podospora pseudocomata]|uniref:Pheromone n=3 Tax=Podospora TaxID=5144 RepID=A0ABR0HBF4_9PEZI|nr:hypothetical protein QC762_0062650 [Podospora pseudocomata]KAK4665401.1 hypothetical protein QC763_0062050 [Podospora pseudopauciseta]KAK4676556.1 hypothetical protein QC764_0061630 [Podospora pseudoanserina]
MNAQGLSTPDANPGGEIKSGVQLDVDTCQAMSVTASSRKQGRTSAHCSFLDEAEMVSIVTVSS